jgi:hypothetical protein
MSGERYDNPSSFARFPDRPNASSVIADSRSAISTSLSSDALIDERRTKAG